LGEYGDVHTILVLVSLSLSCSLFIFRYNCYYFNKILTHSPLPKQITPLPLASDVIPLPQILDGAVYNINGYNVTRGAGYVGEGNGARIGECFLRSDPICRALATWLRLLDACALRRWPFVRLPFLLPLLVRVLVPSFPPPLLPLLALLLARFPSPRPPAYLAACYGVSNATLGKILPPVMTARVSTRRSASIKLGRVEIRAKLPTGDWVWPALWMLPVDDA
jgi:hypothetical protein